MYDMRGKGREGGGREGEEGGHSLLGQAGGGDVNFAIVRLLGPFLAPRMDGEGGRSRRAQRRGGHSSSNVSRITHCIFIATGCSERTGRHSTIVVSS